VREGVDLVNKAGVALTEIVASIKSVAEIVADIAAASAEQSTGLEQINKALAQMDEVTQQNSALVEENAATAKTLESQAVVMSEKVSIFRIGSAALTSAAAAMAASPQTSPSIARVPASATRPAGKPGITKGSSAARMRTAGATALKESAEWREF
jgi:methyl-accepting chemotaxis protein